MAPTLGRMKEYSTEKNTEGFMHLPTRGGAPAGVALSEDEDEAYVYCRATNDVVIVRLLPATGSYKIAPPIIVSLDTAPDKLLIGRTLFYSSSMNIVSEGMACAGCHPEGRDDGFTWREAKITMNEGRSKETFTNFLAGTDMSSLHSRWGDFEIEGDGGVGYARQTPMIAGRIKAAGPYGWHGESKTINDRVAAGFGLHRWQTSDASESMRLGLAAHIVAFIREGLVPPPKVTRPLTEEEQRGKTIFTSPATQCATCHAPQTEYTDRIPFPLKALKPPATFAEDPNLAYKTPSLLYVGGTAPYMHDGRFSSLETLIEFNQDRMGKTSQLSADDRKALIAFLRTL
jgi:cytochrome c peroxidase